MQLGWWIAQTVREQSSNRPPIKRDRSRQATIPNLTATTNRHAGGLREASFGKILSAGRNPGRAASICEGMRIRNTIGGRSLILCHVFP